MIHLWNNENDKSNKRKQYFRNDISYLYGIIRWAESIQNWFKFISYIFSYP